MNAKVLFITPSLTKGGAETQLMKVARFLRSKNYAVMIISLKPIQQFAIDPGKEGIELVLLDNWTSGFAGNLIKLFRTIRAFKADVVVAFMFIAIIFARLLKLFFDFKLISTIRISVIKSKWYIPFRVTSLLDDSIIYNSLASKNVFEERKLVRKHGYVIYNGISLAETGLEEHVSIERPFRWVCVGHFKYNKDYCTLFKAISLIKHRDFRVDIIGNLYNQTWPSKMIEDLGIESRVRLLGFQSNPAGYLKDADAFVLSSFSEGMPNAILEAMSYYKPIVATNINGNNEVVKGGACGFLTKPSDAVDLAEKMVEMMNLSEAVRFKLGHNGRRFIEANFDERKVMNDWLAAVEDMISVKDKYSGSAIAD